MPFDPDAFLEGRSQPDVDISNFDPDSFLESDPTPVRFLPVERKRTELSDGDEFLFKRIYGDHARRFGLNTDPDAEDQNYDYRGAFVDGAFKRVRADGHLPSRFEDLDHPNRFAQGTNTITGEAVSSPVSQREILTEEGGKEIVDVVEGEEGQFGIFEPTIPPPLINNPPDDFEEDLGSPQFFDTTGVPSDLRPEISISQVARDITGKTALVFLSTQMAALNSGARAIAETALGVSQLPGVAKELIEEVKVGRFSTEAMRQRRLSELLQIEVTKASPELNDLYGKDVRGSEVEEFVKQLDLDRQEWIRSLFASGQGPIAIYSATITTVGDVLTNLTLMKAFFRTLGVKGLRTRGAGWKKMARGTVGRSVLAAVFNFLKTPGSAEERSISALLGFTYMMTPVGSSLAPNKIASVGVDFIANSIITAGFDPTSKQFTKLDGLFEVDPKTGLLKEGGQYKAAFNLSVEMAEAAGNPELLWQYLLVNLLPLVGSDVGFSLLSVSARARNNQIKMAGSTQRPDDASMNEITRRVFRDYTKAAIGAGAPKEWAETANLMALGMFIKGDIDRNMLIVAFESEWTKKPPIKPGSPEVGKAARPLPQPEDEVITLEAKIQRGNFGRRRFRSEVIEGRPLEVEGAVIRETDEQVFMRVKVTEGFEDVVLNKNNWTEVTPKPEELSAIEIREILAGDEGKPVIGETVRPDILEIGKRSGAMRSATGEEMFEEPLRDTPREEVENQRGLVLEDKTPDGLKARLGTLDNAEEARAEILDQAPRMWVVIQKLHSEMIASGEIEKPRTPRTKENVADDIADAWKPNAPGSAADLNAREQGMAVGQRGIVPREMTERPSLSLIKTHVEKLNELLPRSALAPREVQQQEAGQITVYRGDDKVTMVDIVKKFLKKPYMQFHLDRDAAKPRGKNLFESTLPLPRVAIIMTREGNITDIGKDVFEKANPESLDSILAEAQTRGFLAIQIKDDVFIAPKDLPSLRKSTPKVAGDAERLAISVDTAIKTLERLEYTPETFEFVVDGMVRPNLTDSSSLSRNFLIKRIKKIYGGDKPSEQTKVAKENVIKILKLKEDPEDFALERLSDKQVRTLIDKAPRDKVPGVGVGAAEVLKAFYRADTFEEGLERLNRMRMLRGAAVITDIGKIAQGGIPTEDTPFFRLRDEDKADIVEGMPANLKRSAEGQEVIRRTLGSVDYDLPDKFEQSDARKFAIRRLSKQALRAFRNTTEGKMSLYGKYRDSFSRAMVWGSMRYAMGDVALANNNPKLFNTYVEFDRKIRAAHYTVEKEIDQLYIKAKLIKSIGRIDKLGRAIGEIAFKVSPKERSDTSLRLFLSSKPALDSALVTILGIDPRTATFEQARELVAAEKVISDLKESDPQRHKDLMSFMKAIKEDLQGPTAFNVRYIQLRRWMDFWLEKGEEITRREAKGQTKESDDSMRALLAEEEKFTPKRFDPQTNKAEPVARADMQEAARIFRINGKAGLMEHFETVKWGIRQFYWMTVGEMNPERLFPSMIKSILPDLSDKETKSSLNLTGEINSRVGFGNFKQGTLLSNLWRHKTSLQAQADTYDEGRDILRTLDGYANEGKIPKWAFEGMVKYVRSQWGKPDVPDSWVRFLQKFNTAFWTAYPFAISRIAWYSARNFMFQGQIWGPIHTQFRPGDVLAVYPRMFQEIRNPESTVRAYITDVWAKDISQKKAIFYERYLLLDPSEGRQLKGKVLFANQRLWDIGSNLMSASDSANRFLIAVPGYLITEKHVNRFIEGRINQAELEIALKIPALHPMQQNLLMKKFHQARQNGGRRKDFEDFIREKTQIANENINYIYRLAGRSPREQTANIRPFIGLPTYPRGTFERLFRNGMQPVMRAFEEWAANDFKAGTFDWRTFSAGFAVVVEHLVAHAFTTILAANLIGEKRDPFESDVKETVPTFGWLHSMTFGGLNPGTSVFVDLTVKSGRILAAMMNDSPEDFERKVASLADEAIYFLPILNDLANMFESTGNYAGASNARLLFNHFERMPGNARRTLWESFAHFLFGTFEFHDGRTFEEQKIDAFKGI